MIRHALRNALIPIITVIGLSLPDLVGGAVIIETVFSWPGMGLMMVEGVDQSRLPDDHGPQPRRGDRRPGRRTC